MVSCRAAKMWLPPAGARRPQHRSPTALPVGLGGNAALRRRQPMHTRRTRTVVSSFFGVGAPEAALVGVVAVVVFGPQGLIDAAKAAAATIRSFQPAIQEINQASSEIRTTITNEMGIDKLQEEFREISQTTRDSLSFNPTMTSTAASMAPTQPASDKQPETSDKQPAQATPATTIPQELESFESRVARGAGLDIDPDIERKREESAKLAWGGADNVPESQPQPALSSNGGPKRLEDMSMAELERELERRKKLIQAIENLNG